MVLSAVCGMAAARMSEKKESRIATPARSMVAARILMMSLVARYVVLRGCGGRLVQVRGAASVECRSSKGKWVWVEMKG